MDKKYMFNIHHKYVKPSTVLASWNKKLKKLQSLREKLVCNYGTYDRDEPESLTKIWDDEISIATSMYTDLGSKFVSVTEPLVDNGDYESGVNMLLYLQELITEQTSSAKETESQVEQRAEAIHQYCWAGSKVYNLDYLYVIPASMSTVADLHQAKTADVADIFDSVLDNVKANIKVLKGIIKSLKNTYHVKA